MGELDYTSDYFREVLLSYRLLFGQNKRSRRAFSSRIAGWQKEWISTPNDPKLPVDPILLILGSQGCEAREAQQIYDEIDAEDPADRYSSTSYFQFLGKRLLELQNHVQGHSSQSLLALWYDRRSVQWWWTFWVCDSCHS
jgi:hypothetical protein